MNEHLLQIAICNDLQWILDAPPLLAASSELWDTHRLISDQKFTFTDQQLATLAQARIGKLGGYFEALVGYLFECSPNFDILAQNLAIHSQKQTVGELDLLVLEKHSQEVIHLELAIKFYLWVPGANEPERAWIGAGLTDFLYKKLRRLYSHQLCLPQKARALACWPQHLPFPSQHYLWLTGRYYIPDRQQQTQSLPVTSFTKTPWQINPDAYRSHWIEQPGITLVPPQNLAKADWLCGNPPPNRFSASPLPSQQMRSNSVAPVYVLPTNWQNIAQIKVNGDSPT